MSVREHMAALAAAVEAEGVTHVLDSDVGREIPKAGYVVVYLSDPLRSQHRMPRRHERYGFEFMVRCVGRDARQARWLSERVDRLVDTSLTVAGWECRRIFPRYAGYPTRDDDLTSTVTEIVSGYGYDAFRAVTGP